MFDDLRQKLIQNEPEAESPEPKQPDPAPRSRRRARGFLGLTPFQGFFLALMVFLNVCVLGFFALVAFGRIQLPGL
ncbi:MAG: hypothetical protein JNL73_20690 [Anaerolineales bacterium]|nr:hypothetical protein [Anaerolineales bacterium]